jgi:hypothetical protein
MEIRKPVYKCLSLISVAHSSNLHGPRSPNQSIIFFLLPLITPFLSWSLEDRDRQREKGGTRTDRNRNHRSSQSQPKKHESRAAGQAGA